MCTRAMPIYIFRKSREGYVGFGLKNYEKGLEVKGLKKTEGNVSDVDRWTPISLKLLSLKFNITNSTTTTTISTTITTSGKSLWDRSFYFLLQVLKFLSFFSGLKIKEGRSSSFLSASSARVSSSPAYPPPENAPIKSNHSNKLYRHVRSIKRLYGNETSSGICRRVSFVSFQLLSAFFAM